MKFSTHIGKLAHIIEKYKGIKLKDNVEEDIRDLKCTVKTPSGDTGINYIIKKENLQGIKIVLETGIEIKCANRHILRKDGSDVFAEDLVLNDYIETYNGNVKVKKIEYLRDTTFYDIGIDSPYLYYDANGVLHHNTIITATLSKVTEPYGRSLVIVPNKSLVVQTETDYKNCGLDVGVYFGDRKELGKTHTICTWQSLNILDKKSKNKEDTLTLADFLENVSTVIIDECFTGHMLVQTPNGKIPIKELRSGDAVINFCEKTQQFKEDTIVKVHRNLVNSMSSTMLELTFSNNARVEVTHNHKFLTNNGWIRADQLTTDVLINANPIGVFLISKKEIYKPDTIYNLHIKNDHNYLVEDIVVANCHQAKAEVLKNILTRNLKNTPIRWGLTGTIPKESFEFESIHASLGPVIGAISASELQGKDILSSCHINILQLLETQVFRDYQSELKYLVTNKSRVEYFAKLFNKIKESGNTMILVDRITTGELLHELIPESVFVNGSMKLKSRNTAYTDIDNGENQIVIATYGVAAVGINIVNLHNVVLIEPGKSFVRVIQSIGRGLRKSKNKDFVQIWDISSTCKFSKKHLTERKKFYKQAEYPFTIEKVDWQKG